jgi:serine/threonine protein kinase
MVTDCYTGGEMMEYIAKQKEDLRTEDISRISFQLLSSVNHCANNNIIHRDIKPENVMFETEAAGADLRLIDFGCSTNKVVEDLHTTFAGTPFYNSPEMFQNKYSNKTDLWSVGVLLYVLVAGYPSDQLQAAFNKLLDAKRKTTMNLPNMPQDLPKSYFEMLDELLTYRQKQRKSGVEILKMDFVVFHMDLEEEGAEEEEGGDEVSEIPAKPSARKSRMVRTPSTAVLGSVGRHSAFLDFKTFERSLTTCLATMLDSNELGKLMSILQERFVGDTENPQLQVVLVKQLKEILKLEINNPAW